MSLTGNAPVSRERGEEGKLSKERYALLQRYIQTESGIVIENDRQYLFESRLLPIIGLPIAKTLKIETLDDLCQSLVMRSSMELRMLVLDAMTTNETFFFRDPSLFDALGAAVLPAMFHRIRGTRKLRIWSAASSSGQEAYSLAILLREMGRSSSDVEILGTDLSIQMLERAREARYVPFEVKRGLPAAYLNRYFTKAGTDWQLADEIRSMVHFEQIDLRRIPAKMGTFDLILCRNVLIYFNWETKKQVISAMKRSLSPGGFLALGCAETFINMECGFQREQIGLATFYSA
jgi:chemotaxis protein methyltransferase CheR